MHKAAFVLACLLDASHGWRVQTSPEGLRHSVRSKAATSSLRPAVAYTAQKHIEAPVISHDADASTPRNAPPPIMLDREIDSRSSVPVKDTDLRLSASVKEPAVDSPLPETNSASRTSSAPAQAGASRARGETFWWSKVLGVRWAMLAGIAALFSKMKLFQPSSAQGARSGQVTACGGYDTALIDPKDFTDEERSYFLNRTTKESKREILLAQGWGSVLLVVGTALSLSLANGSSAEAYCNFWERVVGYGPKVWHFTMPVRDWVNEAAMSFFFFLVGMEIKREILFGSLRNIRAAALPCAAAFGGMVVPTAIYCIVQASCGAALSGWAIPMATDIAFAMGVYGLFRSRMPAGVAAFLLTLATVDDLGAIAVIAVAFAKHINLLFLGGAGLTCLLLEYLRRWRCRSSKAWLGTGVSLWYCLLRGGVNADVAGVIAAFFIPTVAAPKWTKAQGELPNLLDHYIHYWTGWANFLIMPLFAVANTAVFLGKHNASTIMNAPVAKGIMAGLLLGKPLGIAGASLLSLKLGWCSWPTGMKPVHLAICGLLGGIAFTMSLFLIEQSLVGTTAMYAKLAVIAGSSIAAVASSIWMSNMKIEDAKEDATESIDAALAIVQAEEQAEADEAALEEEQSKVEAPANSGVAEAPEKSAVELLPELVAQQAAAEQWWGKVGQKLEAAAESRRAETMAEAEDATEKEDDSIKEDIAKSSEEAVATAIKDDSKNDDAEKSSEEADATEKEDSIKENIAKSLEEADTTEEKDDSKNDDVEKSSEEADATEKEDNIEKSSEEAEARKATEKKTAEEWWGRAAQKLESAVESRRANLKAEEQEDT